MKDEEIDRALRGQDAIVPSSGFAGAVMEAVRREAAAPAPIPFPWKRAIPGMAAWAVAVAAAVMGLMRATPTVGTTIWRAVEGLPVWAMTAVLALVAAWACVKWAMRLAGGKA